MTRDEQEDAILDVLKKYFIDCGNTYGYKVAEKIIVALNAEPCEDAVSRADTLQSFESYCENNCQYSKKQRDVMCGACMMGDAIEIVENLPPVTPKPLDTVLDEIRAEIPKLVCCENEYRQALVKVADVIKCIDKHRVESEGK